MMKALKLPMFLSLFLLGITSSFACDMHGKTGIVPKNNLYIKVQSSNKFQKKVGLSEEEFNQSIDKVTSTFKDIVASKGAELVVKKDWEDGTVNAFANRDKDKWVMTFFGGFARHKAITKDGITLLACHELGHHMGGAPVKRSFLRFKKWATNEGQADYWGSLKCLRRIFAVEDNIAAIREMKIPTVVKEKCSKSFFGNQERALCMRSAMAGLALTNVFTSIRQLQAGPKFSAPSDKKVRKTNKKHPEPQCRLDTYFNASLCTKSIREEVSYKDAKAGVCSRHTQEGDFGTRPLCWYKPKRK